MCKNVGSFDLAARAVLGGGLLIVANHGHTLAGACAVVLLASASLRFCPLWWVLRLDTGRSEKTYGRSRWPADEN